MSIRKKLRKKLGENELKDYVIRYYLGENNIKTSMEDLFKYGCQSGMIDSLVFYSDTCKFYEKYKYEINELASELVSSTGYNSIFDLIPRLDKEDPLILEDYNKNIMAWYGFEEMSRELYEELFYEKEREKYEAEL